MDKAATTLFDEAERLLSGANFCALATLTPGGAPHVTTVWIHLEDSEVLLATFESALKTANLRRNSKVGLVVTNAHNPYEEVSLIGEAEEIGPGGANALLDRLALKYSGEPYRGDMLGLRYLVFRIRPTKVMYHRSDMYP
jgi:PPOX class probable F420-dependent enzyme